MLQVTVKLIFNISLGLIFYLILISCMVVVMVFGSHETKPMQKHAAGMLQRPPPVTSPPHSDFIFRKKSFSKNYAWLSQPTAIPAKMRFRTAAGESGQRTGRNQQILLLCLVKVRFCNKASLEIFKWPVQ